MLERFPELKQRGPDDCLPTAVRAVLLHYGQEVSADDVSRWCEESHRDCWFDTALHGLADYYDLDDLTMRGEEAVRALVTDPERPGPVIVMLQDPNHPGPLDHAVVLIGIQCEPRERETAEVVRYMDPWYGSIEEDDSGAFWQHWNFNGG